VEEWISEDEYDVPAGFEEESQPGLAEEFAAESLWKYQTALDERVCGRCAPLEGVMFSLDEINEQFPNNQNFGDIIFVNMDDHGGKCRCTLIREPGTGEGMAGGEEDMVEGRGTPLGGNTDGAPLSPLGLARAFRSPRSALRMATRQVFGLIGLGAMASPLAAVIFSAVIPMVQSYIEQQVKAQVEAETRRLKSELRKAVLENRLEDAVSLQQKYNRVMGE
jgi:hypothetical protein